MSRATKAELQGRVWELEVALDRLMASHRDYLEATDRNSVDHEWALRIQNAAHRIRHDLVGDVAA